MTVENEVFAFAIEVADRFPANQAKLGRRIADLASRMTGFAVEVYPSSVEFLIVLPKNRGRLTLERPIDVDRLLGWEDIRVCSDRDAAEAQSIAATDRIDMEDRQHALASADVIADGVRDLIGDGKLKFHLVPKRAGGAVDQGHVNVLVRVPGHEFSVTVSAGADPFSTFCHRLAALMAPYHARIAQARSAE